MRSWQAFIHKVGSAWDEERSPIGWPVTIAALLGFLAVVLFRFPEITLTPRFWAEEGTVYFQAAYDRGFAALFESHQGYYALLPNVAGWMATLVPLHRAPVVTLIISAAVQLIAPLLVLRSRATLLPNGVRAAILVVLLVNPSGTIELWLNTVNSQSFLQVVVFLLLIEPRLRVPHLLLLLGCVLSTPTVIVPAAAFLVRALLRGRRWREWTAAGFWLTGVIVGFLQLHPSVRPFAGPKVWAVSIIRENFGRAWFGIDLPDLSAIVGGVIVLGILLAVLVASRSPVLWAFASVGVLSAVSNAALSLSGAGGARYSFGPFVMEFTVLAIAIAGPIRLKFLALVGAALIGVAFFQGAVKFEERWGLAWAGPSWAEQVVSHESVVTIWPYPPWAVVLRPS